MDTAFLPDRVYGPKGIHANAVMPGGISTGLQKHDKDLQEMMKDPKVIKGMKSPAQGAATTVWAAVADDFASSGGHYLENLTITELVDRDNADKQAPGHAEHAFDKEKEDRLWKISNELVGFQEN